MVILRDSYDQKPCRISGNRSENECGQHEAVLRRTTTAVGEGANNLAEITERGGSPAPILQFQSVHHAAASTSLHANIGRRSKIITISLTF